MKKFFNLICLMVIALTLAACGASTMTIKFETNGGNEIPDIAVTAETFADFKLPTDPTKDGYNFMGWYLDEELTNSDLNSAIGAFKKDATITLYAKWEEMSMGEKATEALTSAQDKVGEIKEAMTGKGFEATITASFSDDDADSYTDKDGNELNSHASTVSADITVNIAIENLVVEKFKDLKATLSVTAEITPEPEPDAEPTTQTIAITLALDDGWLYAVLPEEIMADVSDGQVTTSLALKIELAPLLKALEDVVKEGAISKGFDLANINIDTAQIIATIAEVADMLEEKAKECGIDFNDIFNIFKLLIPTIVPTGNTTTITFTQEQLDFFVSKITTFLTDEAKVAKLYDFYLKAEEWIAAKWPAQEEVTPQEGAPVAGDPQVGTDPQEEADPQEEETSITLEEFKEEVKDIVKKLADIPFNIDLLKLSLTTNEDDILTALSFDGKITVNDSDDCYYDSETGYIYSDNYSGTYIEVTGKSSETYELKIGYELTSFTPTVAVPSESEKLLYADMTKMAVNAIGNLIAPEAIDAP